MKELELFFEKQINEHQLIVERSKSLLMDSFLATVKICIDSLKMAAIPHQEILTATRTGKVKKDLIKLTIFII